MATVDKLTILRDGALRVTGRLVDASNATLYATSTHNENEMICIYKPIAGERPLWDFSDGSLAYREYAAYLISDRIGFNLVPLTILRDGPYGEGMVQEWIDKKTGKKKRQALWFYEAFANAKSSAERSTIRSKTFQGIADAMGQQWG